jgi:NADH-quinone oxidoreductase subunit E
VSLVPKVPEPEWEERVPEEIQGELLEDVSLAAEPAIEEERGVDREPAPVPEPSEVEVPRALAQEIRRAMKRYPEKRSAAIPALWAVQRHHGWCSPEGIRQAAAVMELTPGYLESVASFYDLFHLEPQGEHEVLVCTNISCWLRGGDELLNAFEQAAGGSDDVRARDSATGDLVEQPPDDVLVRGFECLGACDLAPMASIDERYYGPLEDGDAVDAIEQLRGSREVLPEKRLEDRPLAGDPRPPADERITRHPINKVKQKRRAPAKAKAAPKPKPSGGKD